MPPGLQLPPSPPLRSPPRQIWRGGASLQASTWAFPSLDSLLPPLLGGWRSWVDTGMLNSRKAFPILAGSWLPLRPFLLQADPKADVSLCLSPPLHPQPSLLIDWPSAEKAFCPALASMKLETSYPISPLPLSHAHKPPAFMGFLRHWPASCHAKAMFFPGDNSGEDLHTPNSGECRRCQVRLCSSWPDSQTPSTSALSPFTLSQHGLCSRDAIAKVLYALLFGWLITRVNALVSPKQDTLSIAILDIYGFEVGLSGTRLGLALGKLFSEAGWGQCVTGFCDCGSDIYQANTGEPSSQLSGRNTPR